jgi:hypothetical protein
MRQVHEDWFNGRRDGRRWCRILVGICDEYLAILVFDFPILLIVLPAKAGIQPSKGAIAAQWIPVFAANPTLGGFRAESLSSHSATIRFRSRAVFHFSKK